MKIIFYVPVNTDKPKFVAFLAVFCTTASFIIQISSSKMSWNEMSSFFFLLIITKLQHKEKQTKKKGSKKVQFDYLKKTGAINERWLCTISQIYLVKYKIYKSFKIFFGIWLSGKGNNRYQELHYEQSVRKFHFLVSPAFFSIIDLDLSRRRKFAKLGDISSILDAILAPVVKQWIANDIQSYGSK